MFKAGIIRLFFARFPGSLTGHMVADAVWYVPRLWLLK